MVGVVAVRGKTLHSSSLHTERCFSLPLRPTVSRWEPLETRNCWHIPRIIPPTCHPGAPSFNLLPYEHQ